MVELNQITIAVLAHYEMFCSWVLGWLDRSSWVELVEKFWFKVCKEINFIFQTIFRLSHYENGDSNDDDTYPPWTTELLTTEYSVAEYSLFIYELYVDDECHVLLMLPRAFWRIDDPYCLIATSTKAWHSCIVYKYLLLSAWVWWVRLIQMTVESLI